jgi:hypothetical protein
VNKKVFIFQCAIHPVEIKDIIIILTTFSGVAILDFVIISVKGHGVIFVKETMSQAFNINETYRKG